MRAGAVGAVVVGDRGSRTAGTARADPTHDRRDVVGLVVGRDHHEHPAHPGYLVRARIASVASLTVLRSAGVPAVLPGCPLPAAQHAPRRPGPPRPARRAPPPATSRGGWRGYVPSSSRSCRTTTARVLNPVASLYPPVGCDEPGHPDRGGHQRRPAVLDRPQPHHGQLLAGLGHVEGGVVGLHHQQLRAAGDGVADHLVVGDLEADHVAEHAPARRAAPRGRCRARSRCGSGRPAC